MNFSVGQILKPDSYNHYFDWEAARRLGKAFLGLLVILTLYAWIGIEIAQGAGKFIPN